MYIFVSDIPISTTKITKLGVGRKNEICFWIDITKNEIYHKANYDGSRGWYLRFTSTYLIQCSKLFYNGRSIDTGGLRRIMGAV